MITLPAETTELRYGGLAYAWHEGAFLSRPQALYALERLWALVAGAAGWEGAAALVFPAISRKQVDAELDLPPGALDWSPLTGVLPEGALLGMDTDSLPALCRVLDGQPARYEGNGHFPLDLPAAVYLGLTRWEEWKRPAPDAFGCHDEKSTQCVRQGFHDRPVLDEWALVLRKWVEAGTPSWQPVLPGVRFWISHDIDVPWFFKDLPRVMRGVAKGLVRQHSPVLALQNLVTGLRALKEPKVDPCYQGVRKLMELDESLGLKGTFFFMTAAKGGVDEGYDLKHPGLRALLEEARDRGHEIGWHVGERASRHPELFARERDLFFEMNGNDGCGVRHHYLAWRGPESWRRLADSGFAFDSSLGYNYFPGGFRCGTAHPFHAYDLQSDRVLPLIERPLVVMDSPVMITARDSSLSTEAGNMTRIFNRTAVSGGCFSILVHNTVDWYYQGAFVFFRKWLNENFHQGG